MSISICCVNIDSISMKQLSCTYDKVSAYTVNRVQTYKYEDDKKRCLVGELLTRYMVIKEYGFINSDLIFDRTSYGKPYIRNCREIYFSISHSGKWVMCALNDSPIGVDIEFIRHQQHENLEIADYFFSDYESERIACKLNDIEKEVEFYNLWTMKESYLKILGIGLYKELNTFEIKVFNGENKVFDEGNEKNNYFFVNGIYDVEYAMSVCMYSENNKKNRFCIEMIEQIELEQILDTIERSLSY